MRSQRPVQPEKPIATRRGTLSLIVSLTGWGVTILVALLSNWTTIPVWGRYVAFGLIGVTFVLALVLGIVPAARLIKRWIGAAKKARYRRRCFQQLGEVVQDVRDLLEPNLTSSLRNYVDSLTNQSVNNEALHSQIRRLSERLVILSDWRWLLLIYLGSGSIQAAAFQDVSRNITAFYRHLSDVVRTVAERKFSESVSPMSFDDQRRMVREKYNQHIELVEKTLVAFRNSIGEGPIGAFHRF